MLYGAASHNITTAAAAETGGGFAVPLTIFSPCVKQLRHFFHTCHGEPPPPHPKSNGKLSPAAVHWSLQGCGWFFLTLLSYLGKLAEKQMPPDCILLLQLLFTKSQETHLVIPWEDWRRGTLTVQHDRRSPTGPPLLRLETLSALRQNAVTLS